MANYESAATAAVDDRETVAVKEDVAVEHERRGRRSKRRGQAVFLVADDETGRQEGPPLSLLHVWNVLWAGKYVVLLAALTFTGLAVAYAINARQWYRAEVVLVPPSTGGGGSLASRLGGLGSVGGLIGNLGVGLDGNDAKALAVLQSSGFTRAFIKDENLLPILYAKNWDVAAGKWRSADPKSWPDLDDAAAFFEKSIRKVQDDKKTGLVRLAIEWTDPKQAAAWANLLVDRLNDRMRERALAESEAHVRYLRQVIATESTVILQQSIGHVLEGELQKEMLARGNKEFSFEVVDRAEPPKWRVRPKRTQIVVMAAVLGALAGMGIVLLRRAVLRDLARSRQGRELAD